MHRLHTTFTVISALLLALGIACVPLGGPIPDSTVVLTTPTATLGTGTAILVTPVASPTTTPVNAPSVKELARNISGERAQRHVEQLSGTIGSRPTGTNSERAAADYIARQLHDFGYKAQLQPFQFSYYEEISARLSVTSPALEVIDANVLTYSPAGSISGTLVAVGLGRPEDIPQGALRGRIALIERGVIPFADKVKNVAEAGAVGAIIYNNQSGGFRGTLGQLGALPVVSISQADGHRLATLLGQGPTEMSLTVQGAVRVVHSTNVVGTAASDGECAIIAGGHYDSVSAGPGANDNASGSAVALELAQALAPAASREKLCFVLFGGEELGLWGSRRYVEMMSSEARQRLLGMINLDMVGVGQEWKIHGSPRLVDLALQAAQEAGISATSFQLPRGVASDHSSFMSADLPAVFVHRIDDPNYHTEQDRAEFVTAPALREAGLIAAGIIAQLAGD